MKCYAFSSCFLERKMNHFCVFTKEIVVADFSYLLEKTHCLMLLSFVSRQRPDLWTEVTLTKAAQSPTRAEASTGQAWPCCNISSRWPPRCEVGELCWVPAPACAWRAPEPRCVRGVCAGTRPAKATRLFNREEITAQVASSCVHETFAALGWTVATGAQGNTLLLARWVSLV